MLPTDELSAYLCEDDFAPLVRAHARAAIPLKAGEEILYKMFPLPRREQAIVARPG